MALSDSVTPEVTPLGSPAGRFEASPLTDTKMGPQQFVDRFAREDVGGMDNFSDIPEPNKIPTENNVTYIAVATHTWCVTRVSVTWERSQSWCE